MRDTMLKIPGNPPNPDEGDLYEKIETRPGTTEKQREAGRGAYKNCSKLMLDGQGAPTGLDFPKRLPRKGGTTFLNQPIKSSQDLAIMAQILRDPRYETLRIFYTRMNRIVHHTAVSSRLPGAVYLEKIGHAKHDLGVLVEKTRRHVKSDGYWLLHNHPSVMLRHRVRMSGSQKELHQLFRVSKAMWLLIPVNTVSLIKTVMSILWIGWAIRQEVIRIVIIKVMNCSWRK
ncbi:MAG: hypothetical protein IPF57_24135 [Gammaproteobacteria bacterium]|nr:hypothetical protein [Gammaproteobacteria bacterium]